mgnify:CR=1 FL=1
MIIINARKAMKEFHRDSSDNLRYYWEEKFRRLKRKNKKFFGGIFLELQEEDSLLSKIVEFEQTLE